MRNLHSRILANLLFFSFIPLIGLSQTTNAINTPTQNLPCATALTNAGKAVNNILMTTTRNGFVTQCSNTTSMPTHNNILNLYQINQANIFLNQSIKCVQAAINATVNQTNMNTIFSFNYNYILNGSGAGMQITQDTCYWNETSNLFVRPVIYL